MRYLTFHAGGDFLAVSCKAMRRLWRILFFRAACLLCSTGLLLGAGALTPPDAHAQDSEQLARSAIQELIPGEITVLGVTVGSGYFFGTLPEVDGTEPVVAGFKAEGQDKYNIVIHFPKSFSLSDYTSLPEDAGEPLLDLLVSDARLFAVPQDNLADGVAVPDAVADIVGAPEVDLAKRMSVRASVQPAGRLLEWYDEFALPDNPLPLDIDLPPGDFSVPFDAGVLAQILWEQLDLQVTLDSTSPSWLPSVLNFTEAFDLRIRGPKKGASTEISTAMKVELGTEAFSLDDVVVKRSTENGTTTFSCELAAGEANKLTPPIPNVAVENVHLVGTLAGGVADMQLKGDLSVGAKTLLLVVDLATEYAIFIKPGKEDGITLADLSGIDVPGLNDTAVESVTVGADYISGDIRLGEVLLKAVAFKEKDQKVMNLALLAEEELTLSHIAKVAENTPLDQFAMEPAALVVVPKENPAGRVKVPTPISDQIGETEMDLKPGVSLTAQAKPRGALRTWFKELGIPAGSSLPLNGTIPQGVFANSLDADALREQLDLRFTLDSTSPSRLPSILSFTRDFDVRIRGTDEGVSTEISTAMKVELGGETIPLEDVVITRDTGSGTTTFSCILPAEEANKLTPPIPNVRMGKVRLDGTLTDSGADLQLKGDLSVSAKKLRIVVDLATEYTIFIKPVDEDGITLADLSGIDVPGLSDMAVAGVTVGADYISGNIRLGEVSLTVIVFAAQQGSPDKNVALLAGKPLMLSDIVEAAKDRLFDLGMKQPALVVVAEKNPVGQVKVPKPISDRIGEDRPDLRHGVNVFARADVDPEGDVGTLLVALKALPGESPPLRGRFDPGFFSSPATLPDLELTFPLGDISLAGSQDFLEVENSLLRIKVENGDPSFAVESDVSIAIEDGPPDFHASITAGKDYTRLSGEAKEQWNNPFDIDWLTLRNLKLSARFGSQPAFVCSARTDLDPVQDLQVVLSFEQEARNVELRDADIPLSAIDGLSALPHSDRFFLRDIVVSNTDTDGTAIAGKARYEGEEWLNAVLFQSARNWNLVLLRDDVKLIDIIPGLAALDNPILDQITLESLAMIVSQSGIEEKPENLSPVAREHLRKIYGEAALRLPSGLGLATGFNPHSLGTEFAEALNALGVADEKLALSGAIGGLFGSPLGLELAAALPGFALPPELDPFFPAESLGESSFFIRYNTREGVALGVALAADLNLAKADDPEFILDTEIHFELKTGGGFEIGGGGTTEDAWKDALAIKGLTLEPGFSVHVSGPTPVAVEIDSAKVQVGEKELRLDGTFGPLGVGIGGEVSKLSLADIMALTNSMASAAGNDRIDTRGFPSAELRGGAIAFASPGVPLEEYGIVAGGTHLAGALYLYGDKWGKFDGTFGPTGLSAKGNINNLRIGTMSMKDCKLDVYAMVDPENPPHFRVAGEFDDAGGNDQAGLFSGGSDTEVDLALSSKRLSLEMDQKIDNGGFSYGFGAFINLPEPVSLDKLAGFDMGLNAHIEPQSVLDWLTVDGRKSVDVVLKDFEETVAAIKAVRDSCQGIVDDLNEKITAARQEVNDERADREQQIEKLNEQIITLGDEIEKRKGKIGDYKDEIKTCDQKKRICVWYKYDIKKGKFKCARRKSVADVGKRAECEANNLYYEGLIKTAEAANAVTQATLDGAKETLDAINEGADSIPVDLDPRVAPLIAEREVARLPLEVAKVAYAAVEAVDTAVEEMNKIFDDIFDEKSIRIDRAAVRGSLNEALKGNAVVVALDYTLTFRGYEIPLQTHLPIKMTDPEYTAEQLEAVAFNLAWHGASAAARAGVSIPSELRDLIRDRRQEKSRAAENELADVHGALDIDIDEADDEEGEAEYDESVALGEADEAKEEDSAALEVVGQTQEEGEERQERLDGLAAQIKEAHIRHLNVRLDSLKLVPGGLDPERWKPPGGGVIRPMDR